MFKVTVNLHRGTYTHYVIDSHIFKLAITIFKAKKNQEGTQQVQNIATKTKKIRTEQA